LNIDGRSLKEIKTWKGGDDVLDLHYLLAACKLALDDSELEIDKVKNDIGLILAHENPGVDQFIEKTFLNSYETLKNIDISMQDFLVSNFSKYKRNVYDLQTFMFLYHIGKVFGIHGQTLFLNNACASGLYALENASMLIKAGHCSAVLVAAADSPDIYKYFWFKEMGLYSEDGIIRPFTTKANGLVFGDGSSGLVLENYDLAKKRNAKIYAEYLGGSFSFDGWKVLWPAITQTYYRDTIIDALNRAGIRKEKIDLVVPHGVGLKIADKFEASVLEEIFDSSSVDFTAFKPLIGHNLGGSSLIETIILLLCMKSEIVPCTLNYSNSDRITSLKFLEKDEKKRIKFSLKTVAAFAGFNGAIVLKQDN